MGVGAHHQHVDLDLHQHEILQGVFELADPDPPTPTLGQFWYRTGTNRGVIETATGPKEIAWTTDTGTGGGVPVSKTLAYEPSGRIDFVTFVDSGDTIDLSYTDGVLTSVVDQPAGVTKTPQYDAGGRLVGIVVA